MRTTNEYLDDIKKKLAITSDYALAKALGVSKQTVSRWSQGKGHFDDEIAVRVASILGLHPGIVILDTHHARAKTPAEATVWMEIFEGFRTLLQHAKTRGALSPAW
jgi:plasmid maintenance system antidote protein VapI